jgi:hypothetical protein
MNRPPDVFTTLDTRIMLCPSGKFAYADMAVAKQIAAGKAVI